LEARLFKKFVDNLESPSPNVLRIARMRSSSGMEPLPFSADHAAWRDTLRDPYCIKDDPTVQSSLRWNEAATANAIQFWRIIPSGFGAFMDVRSGQSWIIIATPDDRDKDENIDYFTRWDRYLQGFQRMDPIFTVKNGLEAIRIEAGNRL
jgi:hypothetical protein